MWLETIGIVLPFIMQPVWQQRNRKEDIIVLSLEV